MSRHSCWRSIGVVWAIVLLGVVWAIVLLLDPHTGLAQVGAQHSLVDLICITNRPVIMEGGSTRVQAWAAAPDGTPISVPISFEWDVTEGSVQGSGSEVHWDLSKVRLHPSEDDKRVTASAKAMIAGRVDANCLVEVFIARPDEEAPTDVATGTRSGLRAARQYLLPNQHEEKGFGLYSYLLFPGRPENDEETTRYLKTLESCLLKMESVEEHLKRHRPKRELNATHIPVKAIPKYSADPPAWAANVLAVYDYAAAQALLDKLEAPFREGPYLVSVVKDPLSSRPKPVQNHLLTDFSGKVPELTSQVMELFMDRTAQQRIWTDVSLRSFGLNLRNLVAVAGKVAPEVVSTIISVRRATRSR